MLKASGNRRRRSAMKIPAVLVVLLVLVILGLIAAASGHIGG